MKSLGVLGWMAAAVFALQGGAAAEMISGKVMRTDSALGKLVLETTGVASDQQDGAVEIAVQAGTAYFGVAGFDAIAEGQKLFVEAFRDTAAGGWTATSVTAANDQEAEPTATTLDPQAEPRN